MATEQLKYDPTDEELEADAAKFKKANRIGTPVYQTICALREVLNEDHADWLLPELLQKVQSSLPDVTEALLVHCLHVLRNWREVEFDAYFDFSAKELLMHVVKINEPPNSVFWQGVN